MLLEENKVIGGKEYFLGHTKDYVRVAIAASAFGMTTNILVNVKVAGFLSDEILLADYHA